MGEEFKDFEVEAPVLTLEPDLTEEKEEIAAKEPEKPQEPAVEEPVLSPQEQKIVEDFAAKIDIENTNQILQYGAGTQKKMADFSDAALENVQETLINSPVWSSLTAVKENHYYVLDKRLYNLKPNARWGEAYKELADILYPEN